jgi:predicted nucleic acid-binding protein
MTYLLDTNHCIYFINGLEKPLQRRKQAEQQVIQHVRAVSEPVIFFSEATLGEMYYGAQRSNKKTESLEKIAFLKKMFEPLEVNETVWKMFGETLALLHQAGTPLSDRDLLIASTAKVHNHILVTNDTDFKVLPEDFLKCENWAVSPVSDK